MYMCPGPRSPSRCVCSALLLEAPEGVAVREVGGAAVGCRGSLGIRDKRTRKVAVPVSRPRGQLTRGFHGHCAVRVEELPHLAGVVDARAAALPEP